MVSSIGVAELPARARGGDHGHPRARVGSAVLSTIKKSPRWLGNWRAPLAVADWMSKLTRALAHVFFHGRYGVPRARGGDHGHPRARAWGVLYCPRTKSRNVGLEAKVRP